MNKEKAKQILRRHNEWRRGAELSPEDVPTPQEVGDAIDVLCADAPEPGKMIDKDTVLKVVSWLFLHDHLNIKIGGRIADGIIEISSYITNELNKDTAQ